jgi:hypothetical protein
VESRQATTRVEQLIRRTKKRPGGPVLRFVRSLVWKRLTRAAADWTERERRRAASGLIGYWAMAGAPDDGPLTALIIAWAGRDAVDAWAIAGAEGDPRYGALACRQYCERHGLVPDDAVALARFYVLAGQPEKWRALDADGSLIAAADLSDEQRDRLEAWLLARQDWDMLWRLIRRRSPLRAAVGLRGFPEGWLRAQQRTVGAERDRPLVEALSQADLTGLRAALDALVDVGVIHVEVPGRVRAGALSEDGARLAVWTYDTEPDDSNPFGDYLPPGPGTVSVFRLPDGALLARHSVAIWHNADLMYSGRHLAAFTVRLEKDSTEAWLHLCPQDDGPMELAHHDAGDLEHGTVAVAPYDDGFVSVGLDYTVSFHDAAGRRTATYRYTLPDFRDLPHHYSDILHMFPGAKRAQISVDAASGRIVVMRDWFGLVFDARGRTKTELRRIGGLEQHRAWHHITFQGPNALLTAEGRRMFGWDLDRYRPLPSEFEKGCRRIEHPALSMVWIPATGELCCCITARGSKIAEGSDITEPGMGGVYYLDGETYEIVPGQRPLTNRLARALFASAAGTYYGTGGDSSASVVLQPENTAARAVATLADKPVSAWQPTDVDQVRRAALLAERDPRFGPLLDLLSACADSSREPADPAAS